MSVKTRKTRDFSSRHSSYSCTKTNLVQAVIVSIVIVACAMFSGCHPATFAASAFLLRYRENQVRNENAKRTQLARQREARLLAEKSKTSYRFVRQSVETVDDAVRAYKDLEWDKSTKLLKDALSKGGLSSSKENQAYILLGAISYQQGYVNEARNYFVRASEADRTSLPSEELFPPSMIEFYRKVRRR